MPRFSSFLAAAELIESDLWAPYTELGGMSVNGGSDGESPGVPAGGGNAAYVKARGVADRPPDERPDSCSLI